MIHEEATRTWCEEVLAIGTASSDPLVTLLRERAGQLRKCHVKRLIPLWRLDRLLLLERLTSGWSQSLRQPGGIPRIDLLDYQNDPKFVQAQATLEAMPHPPVIHLIYLPLDQEIREKKAFLSKQGRALLGSLERITGTSAHMIPEEDHGTLPRIDLHPHDIHPNDAGLRFYAREVSEIYTDFYTKGITPR